MFCCAGLKNLISNAGERGISALVRKDPEGFRFALQARAVTKEVESQLSQTRTPLPIEGPMSLATSIALNYCPFCGTNLQSLVRWWTKKRLKALAEEHQRFDIRI